ncbi:MAG TPA: hypothetical protein PKZ76_02875 [Xanthomonadaceae bacterium]|nr:hypothetical protein [Xanthomonadaceae bacterium]
MKPYRTFPSRICALALAAFALAAAPASFAAYADPSGRVARLSHIQGDVSFAPAGEGQWYNYIRNRPLTRGDRLWTDRNALAEIQVGSAAIRLGPQTSFEILDLHDGIGQFLVTQGTLSITVRRLYPGQVYEVATPNLAVVIDSPGRYRIDVDPRYDEATIVIWEGAASAYGDYGSFAMYRGEAVRFYGADLRDYDLFRLPRPDAFDRYGLDRDRLLARSGSLRYVGDDLLGYEDLDRYGDWRQVRNIGVVWFPSRVASGWAPYRDGRWVWQEPWGWTWVDNAPWGFAPSHYGRWVHVSNRWGWVPGPRNVRPVYAPALVAFVSGQNWSLSLSLGSSSPIGWFPLGPREVYVPPYQASRNYFTQVNVNNTVVNNTTITNIYNNVYATGATTVTQVGYGNRSVVGAVTAVPAEVFTGAGSVQQAALRVDGDMLARSEIKRIATIAPSARSVTGAAERAKVAPAQGAFERPVVARHVPPPAERSFAAREQQLQRTPGQAPAREAAPEAPRRQDAAARNVRVVPDKAAEVDARAAAALRQADAPRGRTEAQRTPPVLDRSAEPAQRRGPPARGRDDAAAEGPPDALPQQRQRQAEDEKAQAAERARQAEAQRAQAAERGRQLEAQQEQAAERGRQAEAQRAQAAERTRQVDAQRQRQAEAEKAQVAERGRQAEAQQAQAAERARQAEAQQAQAAERARQAEAQRVQAAERARQAEAQQAQAAERTRQAEAQQAQAAERARQAEARQQAEAAEKESADESARQAAEVAQPPARRVPSKAPPARSDAERVAPVPRRDVRQQAEEYDEEDDEDAENDDDVRRDSTGSKADPRARPSRQPPVPE